MRGAKIRRSAFTPLTTASVLKLAVDVALSSGSQSMLPSTCLRSQMIGPRHARSENKALSIHTSHYGFCSQVSRRRRIIFQKPKYAAFNLFEISNDRAAACAERK